MPIVPYKYQMGPSSSCPLAYHTPFLSILLKLLPLLKMLFSFPSTSPNKVWLPVKIKVKFTSMLMIFPESLVWTSEQKVPLSMCFVTFHVLSLLIIQNHRMWIYLYVPSFFPLVPKADIINQLQHSFSLNPDKVSESISVPHVRQPLPIH